MNENNNLQNLQQIKGIESLPAPVKVSIQYSSVGLGFTIFNVIVLNIIFLLIITNLNTSYKWQKIAFYTLLLMMNIFFFIRFYTTFTVLLILTFILIIISSWKYLYNLYLDYTLQKVQDIKYKNFNHILNKKKGSKHKNYGSIWEVFEENFELGLQMLVEHLDKEYGSLWKLYLVVVLLLALNIVLLIALLYVLYGSGYYIK